MDWKIEEITLKSHWKGTKRQDELIEKAKLNNQLLASKQKFLWEALSQRHFPAFSGDHKH